MKKICDTILDTVGGTPMVRIDRITRGIVSAEVLVTLETFNPGNSIKDRIAVKMIDDAERPGCSRRAAQSSKAPESPAVLVRDFKSDKTFIITRSDVMRVL